MSALDLIDDGGLLGESHLIENIFDAIKTNYSLLIAAVAMLIAARGLIGLAVWYDAKARNISTPFVYAALTAAGGIIPGIIYLSVRKSAVDIPARNEKADTQTVRSAMCLIAGVVLFAAGVAYGYSVIAGALKDIKTVYAQSAEDGQVITLVKVFKNAVGRLISGEIKLSDFKVVSPERRALSNVSFWLKVGANVVLAAALQRDATSQNRRHRVSLVIFSVLFGWIAGAIYMCVRHRRGQRYVCGNCGTQVDGGPLSVCKKCGGMLPVLENAHSLAAQETRKQAKFLSGVYLAALTAECAVTMGAWYYFFDASAQMIDRIFG